MEKGRKLLMIKEGGLVIRMMNAEDCPRVSDVICCIPDEFGA
jgi:hypothetical protein